MEFVNASTGLTFGQLLPGDAEEAKIQMDRLLSTRVQNLKVGDQKKPPLDANFL